MSDVILDYVNGLRFDIMSFESNLVGHTRLKTEVVSSRTIGITLHVENPNSPTATVGELKTDGVHSLRNFGFLVTQLFIPIYFFLEATLIPS